MNEQDFLLQLKKDYPHLYDVEMLVREIKEKTGFGDVSINLTVRDGRVELSDIGQFVNIKTKYKHSIRRFQ